MRTTLFLFFAFFSGSAFAQNALSVHYRYFILTDISVKNTGKASDQFGIELQYQKALKKQFGLYGSVGTILLSDKVSSSARRAPNDIRTYTNSYQANILTMDAGVYFITKSKNKAGYIRLDGALGGFYSSYAEQSSFLYEFAFGSVVSSSDTYEFDSFVEPSFSTSCTFGGTVYGPLDFSLGFGYRGSLKKGQKREPVRSVEQPIELYPNAVQTELLYERRLVGSTPRIGFVSLNVGLFYRL